MSDADALRLLLLGSGGVWDQVVNRDQGRSGYGDQLVAKVAGYAARQDPPGDFEACARRLLGQVLTLCDSWRSRGIHCAPTVMWVVEHFGELESWVAGERLTERPRAAAGARPPGRIPVTRVR